MTLQSRVDRAIERHSQADARRKRAERNAHIRTFLNILEIYGDSPDPVRIVLPQLQYMKKAGWPHPVACRWDDSRPSAKKICEMFFDTGLHVSFSNSKYYGIRFVVRKATPMQWEWLETPEERALRLVRRDIHPEATYAPGFIGVFKYPSECSKKPWWKFW